MPVGDQIDEQVSEGFRRALRNERRLRALVLSNSYVIYRMNADWSQVDELDGETLLESRTRPVRGWFETYALPDDIVDLSEKAQVAIREKRSVDLKHRVRRPDGNVQWVLSRIAPILDDDGDIEEWIGSSTELENGGETETLSHDEQDRLRLALQVGELATWDWNLVTGQVIWSDLHYHLQGYAPGEIEPSYEAWAARVHPDDLKATEAALNSARESRVDYHHEFRTVHPDGSDHWMSARGHFFYNSDGQAIRMIGAMRDITSERDALARLLDSEKRYRLLFDSIDEGFCIIEMIYDDEGKPSDYRFLNVNPAFERQTGLKDAVGRTMKSLAPTHETHWFEIYGRIAQTGVGERFENRADALGHWYDVYAFPIGQSGQGQVGILFNDIRERKRAEEALRASEEKYRSLFESIDEGFALLEAIRNETGEIIDFVNREVNAAYETNSGLKDVVGKSLLQLAPNFPSERMDVYRQVLADGVPSRQEYFQPGNGRWYRTHLSRVGGAGSDMIAAVFEDITTRKKSEIALRESEQRLQTAFGALPVAIGIIDTEGHRVLGNAALDRYLSSGAIPTRDAQAVSRWHSWSAKGKPLDPHEYPGARALRGERVFPGIEMIYTQDDGREVWAEVAAVPLLGEQGNLEGLVTVISDIDVLKRQADALRESEGRWRLLANAMPNLVWIADASSGEFTYINDRFADFTGCNTEALSHKGWTHIVHPEDLEHVASAWQQCRNDNHVFDVECRIRGRAGDYRWHQIRAVPAPDSDGHAQQWFGAAADIQNLMEARFQAEAADRAKSEFLANMSHEIRTPLNAVVGLTSIMMAGRTDAETEQKYLRTMQDSATNLTDLINDVLEYAKIDADMVELHEAEFDLKATVDEAARIAGVKASGKGLQIGVHDFTDKTRMIGDSHRVKQIVLNLLSNAVKFTERGSVNIYISTLASDPGRDTVAIMVKDTGIGIAHENFEIIFDKFTQADSSITRRFGGTGLGLAISRRLAEAMGGTLTVESVPGEGTEFTLVLPLRSANAVAAEAEDAAVTKESRCLNVLVVEDNPANAMVAETMLKKLGHRFQTAIDGFEAIELWRAGGFDLILMDIQMPGMDGIIAAKRIRQLERSFSREPVRIVAMTAHALNADRERAIAAGMDDFISKPVAIDVLREKVMA